jgi:hypothetical protein
MPSLTVAVATIFRPILLDLCARWLHSGEIIEEHLIASCLLLEVHEELFPLVPFLLAGVSNLTFCVSSIVSALLKNASICQRSPFLPSIK